MSDKKLLQEIVGWIVVACKSQLPYDFHAKAIRDLVRNHDGQGDYMEGWDEGCKAERQRCIDKYNRIAILAVKHCPSSHHDWQEIKELLIALDGMKDE